MIIFQKSILLALIMVNFEVVNLIKLSSIQILTQTYSVWIVSCTYEQTNLSHFPSCWGKRNLVGSGFHCTKGHTHFYHFSSNENCRIHISQNFDGTLVHIFFPICEPHTYFLRWMIHPQQIFEVVFWLLGLDRHHKFWN